jgi:hypothetical protein
MVEVISGETDDFIAHVTAIAPDYTSGHYVIHHQSPSVKDSESTDSGVGRCIHRKFCKMKATVFKKIQYMLR